MIRKPLGIFIPAYNEENRFPKEEVVYFLNNVEKYQAEKYQLIFVNDGSKDNTAQILLDLQTAYPEQVKVISNKKNQGKAETIRSAFLQEQAHYKLLGYLDCDMATPLIEFYNMGLDAIEKEKHIYFGSRIQKIGSQIERKPKRHYLGRIFATCAAYILNIPIYDTQCGAKYFHHSLIQKVFQTKFISKWLFDIELFARVIIHKGYDYFNEAAFEKPLNQWLEKGGSKIKLSDMFQFPLELLKINRQYRKKLKETKNNNAL